MKGESCLLLKRRSLNRLFSLLTFLILLATLIFGYSPYSPTGERGGFPVILVLLLIITLIAALYESSWEFDRERSTVIKRRALFLFRFNFSDEEYRLSPQDRVILRKIPISKEGKFKGLLSFLHSNRTLYKLFIQVEERNIFLEESTDYEELKVLALELSGFLKVPYREEQLD